MFDDYGYEEDGSFDDDRAAWNHQMDLELQRQEEDWQSILANDPGYVAWADEIDRQTAEDREIMVLAGINDERNFNVLTAWD